MCVFGASWENKLIGHWHCSSHCRKSEKKKKSLYWRHISEASNRFSWQLRFLEMSCQQFSEVIGQHTSAVGCRRGEGGCSCPLAVWAERDGVRSAGRPSLVRLRAIGDHAARTCFWVQSSAIVRGRDPWGNCTRWSEVTLCTFSYVLHWKSVVCFY